ncbi:MAG: type II CRISPR-associated endonuclease Cas1 [Akkermansiaceae bacterium]
MAWRGIHLTRPAYLSVEHRALKIDFRDEDGGSFRLALEDLAYLILDTPETTLSGRILAALAETGTLVLGVDNRHLPCWTSLPWTRYHRHGEVLQLQLEASVPQKKQLWSKIVRAKINAQAFCLLHNRLDGADKLFNMVQAVRSGDPDNTEARAARSYWNSLFPDRDFRRHDDDLANALLNYGYALLRAAIARQLCGVGFYPPLGLHHDSVSNAFNLADDLIEPYRPLVDHIALVTLGESPSNKPFETNHRRAMASLFEAEVDLDGEIYSVLPAIEVTVNSLKSALVHKEPDILKFPNYKPQLSP